MSERKQTNWKNRGRQQEIEEEQRECNWDEPLPSSETSGGEEEEVLSDEVRRRENLEKLDMYVAQMAYIPAPPPPPPKHIKRLDTLAKPRGYMLQDTYQLFAEFYEPTERRERMRALTAKLDTIPPEKFEEIHKAEKAKKNKKDNLSKRKEELYYELSSKLENQCRSQYLNVLIQKFGDFIADMATTMNIPPQLNEPYARMQRGIFCNIIGALGLRPPTEAAYYYNTRDALEYETIHKCAHALLCLIIKALDSAANKDPDDIAPMEKEFEMDTYIKERLMTAAMKKLGRKNPRRPMKTCLVETLSKCNKFGNMDPCV